MFAGSTPPLEPLVTGPVWWELGLLTAAGLGATWLIARVDALQVVAGLRRWLPIVLVVIWATVAAAWLRRLVQFGGPDGLAHGVAVVVVALAALPWLRDVFHSLVFVVERRYLIGDHLRVADVEGRLVSAGVRGVVLRAADGTESMVPHTSLARAHVVRLELADRDAPCELWLPAPVGLASEVDWEAAADHARAAAALSPYAAPRHAPEVFIEPDPHGGGLGLHLRGYVFDREHAQAYRSDVYASYLRKLGGEA